MLISFSAATFLYRGILIPLFFPPYSSNDFRGVFYPTVKTLLSEGNLYTETYGYFYPPFSAFLIAPLTYVSVYVAEKIWFFILLASLLSSFFLLVTSFSKRTFLFWALLFFVFSQFEPLYVELSYYQVDLLILWILIVAYRLEGKKLFFWSGFFLAIGASIKITPLFFLFYFLVTKKWKSIVGFFAGFLCCSLLALFLVGMKGWVDFFQIGIPRLLIGSSGNSLDQSFANSLVRIEEVLRGGEGLQKASPWVRTGSVAFSMSIIFSLWHFLKKGKHHPLGLEYAAVICAMLLSATTMNETHLVLLLFPFLILVSGLFHIPHHPKQMVLTSIAFVVVALHYGYNAPFLKEALWTLPLAKAKFFGTCLAYLCCLSFLGEER